MDSRKKEVKRIPKTGRITGTKAEPVRKYCTVQYDPRIQGVKVYLNKISSYIKLTNFKEDMVMEWMCHLVRLYCQNHSHKYRRVKSLYLF